MSDIWRRREERWINHYCSRHIILLVGEGDFSFSRALAMAFGSATNIVATSFDTHDTLMTNYKNAYANLAILETMGATLIHGVDATQMRTHPHLQFLKFHRIIYNFPHAGFHGKEDNPELIQLHRNLVHGFLTNASTMLCQEGEIHITHKTTTPFNFWKIEDLALKCSLFCIGQDNFKIEDYPGYQNKRGSGPRPDEPFLLGECCTFRFKRFSDECRWIFGRYLDHVEDTFGRNISSDEVCFVVREALSVGYETYMGQGRSLKGFIDILEELHAISALRTKRLLQRLSRLDRSVDFNEWGP
ncbi:hypothetical protein STAS_30191 [Striga asiatica]|uniref:25S rRNA (uridine-N(3))-methyltransferase BMT5-like domain-containing protein n=1 Tax=Striga asiatica TaxID=4170 RepID=A0A5A7R5M9_STRAF|nr:hypothetical protein STAS_30191 [Striga asiatica]